MSDIKLAQNQNLAETSLPLDLDSGLLLNGHFPIPSLDLRDYGVFFTDIIRFDYNLNAYVGIIDLDRSIPTELFLEKKAQVDRASAEANNGEHVIYVTISKDYNIALRVGRLNNKLQEQTTDSES